MNASLTDSDSTTAGSKKNYDLMPEEGGRGRGTRWWLALGLGLLIVAIVAYAIWQDTRPAVSTGPGPFTGAIGKAVPGTLAYHFKSFDGVSNEPAQVSKGQVIVLRYEAEVTKGSVALSVKSPSGRIMWKQLMGALSFRHGTVRLTAPSSGSYDFAALGADGSGSFNLSWRIK